MLAQVKAAILAITATTTLALLPPDFQSYSAQAKQDTLFLNCYDTRDGQGRLPSIVDMTRFFFRDINPSFDHESDEIYYTGSKPIHSIGSVVMARFDAVDNPFTGAFQGDENVLLRLSLAAAANRKKTIPGLGLKFLRDGVHSGNLVAMFSLDGQPSYNFFAHNFSNHVAPSSNVALKMLEKKFLTASRIPTKVGLSDIAKYDAHGAKVSIPVFPFQIVMEPTSELREKFQNASFTDSLVEMLDGIPSETKLYHVYAREQPASTLIFIGSVTTTSDFIGSTYGDDTLFFQHQRFEEDLKLKPEWIESLAEMNKIRKCPFKFI